MKLFHSVPAFYLAFKFAYQEKLISVKNVYSILYRLCRGENGE